MPLVYISANSPNRRCISLAIGVLMAAAIINNLFFFPCSAQVAEHKIPVSSLGSLSLNTSTDWLDKFYGPKILDSVQVIGLGEVSHGGCEPLAFKIKMIQYLIQKKGYRNILFEQSDFYSIRPIRNYLNNNQIQNITVEKWLKDAGYSSATKCFFSDIFSWLKKYNMEHPNDMVQIAGFDLSNEPTFFTYILNNYIIPFNHEDGQKYVHQLANTSDTIRLQILRAWYDSNKNALKTKFKESEIGWLGFHLSNLEHGVTELKKGIEDNGVGSAAIIFRDSIMAENVRYLAQSRKTIVSGHNGHILRNGLKFMGSYLDKFYQSRYYVILTDFSRSATVQVLARNSSSGGGLYLRTRTFTADPSSAANEILQNFGISSGIFLHKDIVKHRILDRTNTIDAYGTQIMMPMYPKAFESLVVFETISTDCVSKP